MKKLKSLITILIITVFISSCEKDDQTPVNNCTTICQNGGTTNSNCGCDCPPGFTGANCQTSLQNYTTVIVNLNPEYYYQLKPILYWGDNDFGGYLTIDWTVQLFMTDNNTRIYAKVYAFYKEYPTNGNTEAFIDPSLPANQILLYSAPAGKKIYSINSAYASSATEYPAGNFHGTTERININSNSYFNKIDFIGDTSGDDLPSDGTTERSRCRIFFKPFSIILTGQ